MRATRERKPSLKKLEEWEHSHVPKTIDSLHFDAIGPEKASKTAVQLDCLDRAALGTPNPDSGKLPIPLKMHAFFDGGDVAKESRQSEGGLNCMKLAGAIRPNRGE